jgi:hypothetical protein
MAAFHGAHTTRLAGQRISAARHVAIGAAFRRSID